MEFEFSAGILVYRYAASKREFLFLCHSDGLLDLPKGHIEKGESALEAAVRETYEEAGLSIKPLPFFRESMTYWLMRGKSKIKKEVMMFLGEANGKSTVMVSHEHAGYRWLSTDKAVTELKFKNHIALIKCADAYIDKLERLQELNREYSGLHKKHGNWGLSRRFVPGEGRADAKVMLVGQAPGQKEDMMGRPFVGRSGKLLDSLIRKAGLRRQNLYITSVVQFFPPNNRVPNDSEIALCKPFLMRQIDIVNPEFVVLLGTVSAKTLAGITSVSHNHGTVIEREGRKLFITLHPAAAVRIRTNLPLIEADFVKLKGVVSGLG